MAIYRLNGIKWDRANIASVDSDVKVGLLKFINARERELNTIETTTTVYTVGPFAGQPVELCSDGAGMLPLDFNGWTGFYEGGRWVGTTGKPLAIIDTSELAKSKDAGSLGKGYEALGDLFGALSEDPKDHEQETTIRTSIYVPSGIVDDFGDQIKDPAPIGIYSTVGHYYSNSKPQIITWDYKQSSNGLIYAVDDFGNLFALSPALVRPTHAIDFDQPCIRSVYTIGRATYKIHSTARAVDALRAKILAKKRFFADKHLQAVRPVQNAEDVARDLAQLAVIDALIAAKAAQDVAQVLASAQAAAAIEQAQAATAQATAERAPWQMTRAEYTGQQPPAYREAVGNSHRRDVARAIDAGEEVAPDVLADYPEFMPELAMVEAESYDAVTTCELGSTGAIGGAYGHGTATAAPMAHQVASVSHGQQINSKSGHWTARFYTGPDGRPMMAFDESIGGHGAWAFDSGRERMAALQTMARNADQAAAQDKTTTAAQEADAAPLAGVCSTAPSAEAQNPAPLSSGQFKPILPGVSGDAPNDAGKNPAAVSSGQFKSKPAEDSEPEPVARFERVKPFNLDPRALLASGIDAAQLVGLGVNYTGNMANPDGCGAITAATDTRGERMGALRIVATLEDGRIINAEPHYFTAELRPILQFNSKTHGAPYLAQLAGAVATVKASASAAKAQAQDAHAKALIDLAAQYPQLKRAESTYSGGKLAAVNMRILLKAAFSGVKFGVTSDYNSVRVSWTDGPNSAEVNAIIGRFDIGASDSQSDYFYTVRTVFSELFGGCQYLSTSRTNSPAQVAAALAARYPDASARPSVEDYTQGRGVFDFGHYDNEGARRAVRAQLESMGAAKPAIV